MQIYIWLRIFISCALEIIILPLLIGCAFFSRFCKKRYHIGLGPEPLINNCYHKLALAAYGYRAETFVNSVYYITDKFDKKFIFKNRKFNFILLEFLFVDFIYALFSYQCLYIYFTGGPLSRTRLIWRFEPFILKIAKIETVLMPYGGDIQVFDRTPNLYFRHAAAQDYPKHKLRYEIISRRLRLWTVWGSHIISGCDWVDYMDHWDTLMVSHFSIETNIFSEIIPKNNNSKRDEFLILHAPNHRNIKGTSFIVNAIDELNSEGYNIKLVLAERKSNLEILQLIQDVDLIVDQLVIGWYAMFAIEGMLANKPVICYLRADLLELYRTAGLITATEPPIIQSSALSFKEDLRMIIKDPVKLASFASRGYNYVEKMHSIKAIGCQFDRINRSLGLTPFND